MVFIYSCGRKNFTRLKEMSFKFLKWGCLVSIFISFEGSGAVFYVKNEAIQGFFGSNLTPIS